jgi:GH24 family phage-related lysozyme (muramidase)
MHDSVAAAFVRFSSPLEGVFRSMYLDVRGLVTTAIGVLIDPVGLALQLPWKRPDGSLATADEIRAEWLSLKARQDLRNTIAAKQAKATTLRLSDEDVQAITRARLLGNERFLVNDFPKFASMPADAQLCILSMAWALGAGFADTFKSFAKAANACDWVTAKAHCKIRTASNPGILERNRANELCLDNAATVIENDMPRDELHWPNIAQPKKATAQRSEATEESLRREALKAQSLQFDALDIIRREALAELASNDGGPDDAA